MIAEEIILAPIVTEKSNNCIQEGKYTFKVNKKATKVEISKAVEKLFGVKVLKVNTMNVSGKKKRVGYHPKTKTYLTKGGKEVKGTKKFNDSIEEFTGV